MRSGRGRFNILLMQTNYIYMEFYSNFKNKITVANITRLKTYPTLYS